MASRDDDRFRLKAGAPKARTGPRTQRFVTQVLKAASRAGAQGSGSRPASTFGRGRVAAGRAGNGLGANARRVVIKARFVVLKNAGAKSAATHLRYIERDGTTRDGQRGQAYGLDTEAADLQAFEKRGQSDRHQFRFILSVEDAPELEDLRGFTRELMARVQVDLETRLDWVAVDHWDTDNPHTHLVLRGRAADGNNLVIAPDYMAHGMRLRASELATEWLGPRTELEMHQSLLREVEQERLTSLDRALMKQTVANTVDLTAQPAGQQRQTLLRARLQRLETLSLAERIDANRWHLAPQMAHTLTALGERGDILRTMRNAMRGDARECVPETELTAPMVGRIAGMGLADELHDRAYLVVDGIDGRAHYLKLPAGTDLAELPIGGIVEAKPAARDRILDRDIVARSQGGIYRTADHLSQLHQSGSHDPQASVDVYVRRLEALRRASIVERLSDGVWQVPTDFLQKANAHDARRSAGLDVELKSHLTVAQQVRAIGATWLDWRLLRDGGAIGALSLASGRGFGTEVNQAIQARAKFLSSEGLADLRGQRVVLARNLIVTLRERELAIVGKALATEMGQSFRPLKEGERVSGIYRRPIRLVSGRFAVIDDGMGFSLVPWRPVADQRLGHHVSAVIRGSSATWQFGRPRGHGI